MEKKWQHNTTTTDFSSRYKFNGKELDQETGCYYGVYPEIFGRARYYNPSISRWLSVDPLAEKYTSFSPYNFTLNNPVRLVDFDGRSIDKFDWINNGDGTYTAEKGDSASTLARDAGISYARALEIMAKTPKNNSLGNMGTYIDKNDGIVKSAVDEGDIVLVPEQLIEINKVNNLQNSINNDLQLIDETEAKIEVENEKIGFHNNAKIVYEELIKLDKNNATGDKISGGGVGAIMAGSLKASEHEYKVTVHKLNKQRLINIVDSLKKEILFKQDKIIKKGFLPNNYNNFKN